MPKVPGSGRKKGTPNKHGNEVRALAQKHTVAAVRKLVALLQSDDERTALMAAKELLGRGCGRPPVAAEISISAGSSLLAAFDALGQRGLPGDGARVINAP